jgi:hypothetical protein
MKPTSSPKNGRSLVHAVEGFGLFLAHADAALGDDAQARPLDHRCSPRRSGCDGSLRA